MIWMDLLRSRVEQTSQANVARELSVSDTTISLVLSDKYPAKTDKIATKVIAKYAVIACPFLEREISGAECRDYHTREVPTSSGFAMRHWRTCQECPNRRPK